jgi:glycine dehydrogenase subunit 2
MTYAKLIFELSQPQRVGYELPQTFIPDVNLDSLIDPSLFRDTPAELPEVSELDIVRHYTKVSQKNIGIESGFYPLGSCTMKYNPKINDEMAGLDGFKLIHPTQPLSTIQPLLKIYDDTARMLNEITGMGGTSLNTFAGAHGELAGLMIMKSYHESRGDLKRTKVIIPDSAHGTNPASAMMLGYQTITIKSQNGLVDLNALKEVLNDEVAGIMLTNPNTVGLFEKDILIISKLVHDVGGLLYYDGANLNPLLGIARPGDMGFDIMHMNLHKTFSTPHGGGGPGSGPVSVAKHLVPFLPSPVVKKLADNTYMLDEPSTSCGQVGGFYGNFLVVIRAYTYIRTVAHDLMQVGPNAVLNANYIQESLKDLYKLVVDKPCMHEFVFNGLIDQSTGVKTLDIAKRSLDFGIHAPTIYFPLLFDQSIMIEPTEVESKETLDEFIKIFRTIAHEAKTTPEVVKNAPVFTPVGRLDEVGAARNPILHFKALKKHLSL